MKAKFKVKFNDRVVLEHINSSSIVIVPTDYNDSNMTWPVCVASIAPI